VRADLLLAEGHRAERESRHAQPGPAQHLPAALDLGMGVVPWSPLAHGFLTGRYQRDDAGPSGEVRIGAIRDTGFYRAPGDREWAVLDAVRDIAQQVDRSPAQVALNWVSNRPGVASTLVGARTLAQLEDNLAALDFALSQEQTARLTELSEFDHGYPYSMFGFVVDGRDYTVSA
jgi:aryl-alcohol dehydrogenase-like predicted oxidoreductase